VVYEAQAADVLSTAIEEGATVSVGTVIGWLSSAPVARPLHPVPERAGLRRKASPVARRIAATHRIDLELIEGTGPDGRVVRADVELRLTAPEPPPALGVRGEVTVHALTRLQSLVAERMSRSRQDVPDFEVRVRADAEPVLSVRAQLKNAVDSEAPSVNG
jgi:pyruvate/2-oxoglutarate dehydrogenase complex dihydrolipoamide acyltransferase (E2) component